METEYNGVIFIAIGIYKIENLITRKIYIGQSKHIEVRWQEHCRPSANSIISSAIRKYGKENFSFEILEECPTEELDYKEEYYIHKYNSIVPNGYNVEEKIDGNPSYFVNYSKEDFNNIVSDIKTTALSFTEIADKYDLDVSMIYYINRGDYHTIVEETYPLRQVKTKRGTKYCIDCGKQIWYTSTRCVSCDHIHQQRCKRPSREELKFLIRNLSFLKIGKMYNVSDNTIRKWCEQEGLPYKTQIIKNISNEEWQNI
jgi:hypothetical protein